LDEGQLSLCIYIKLIKKGWLTCAAHAPSSGRCQRYLGMHAMLPGGDMPLSTTTIEVTHHHLYGGRARVSDEAVLRLQRAFFLPLSLFSFIALIFMPAHSKINCPSICIYINFSFCFFNFIHFSISPRVFYFI